jgi:3-phosphoshikimate 1-carboxyvinyltransferase
MRARITPGGELRGSTTVPGDKSIAHRWLILAATAQGASRLRGLPASLDVRATAACLAALSPSARPALQGWARRAASEAQGHGFTWDSRDGARRQTQVEINGEGRSRLEEPRAALDCANSGTTLRLLAGVLAAAPFRTVLTGDRSLAARPMERVATPLRAMGADVRTTDGHAPVVVRGGGLRGLRYEVPVPSAQVKSAILLAGCAASDVTTVVEATPTRDHTERALAALGAPIERSDGISIRAFQHAGFAGDVPGDVSSAIFLLVAAALTGSSIEVVEVGLNPTRTHALEVLERMGVRTRIRVAEAGMGEPVGQVAVVSTGDLAPTTVCAQELPLMIDEVPALAMLAAHASGPSRFLGAGELRVKESDRLSAIVAIIESLGGEASVDGADLMIAGGGLRGGRTSAGADHRLAMAAAVAGLGARGPVEVDGIEAADISFPGFASTLRGLGARIEEAG